MEEKKIDIRTLNTESGLTFNLKYITNKQGLLWYNKQEYPQKECEFCAFLIPEKESKFSLRHTGFSFFKGHELLIANNHAGEYIGIHLKHMLDLVDENKNCAVAFEGSKNAPIKKYHFSCHYIDDKNQLPITTDVNKDIYKDVIKQDNLCIGILDTYGRNPIYIKSSSTNTIIAVFHELEKRIGINYSTNNHPYINLAIWKEDENYILAAIPRVVYKPTEYYDENNMWDIAPGVLEMSGVYLIGNHREFVNIEANQLLQITDEVSFNNSHILEILNELDLNKLSLS